MAVGGGRSIGLGWGVPRVACKVGEVPRGRPPWNEVREGGGGGLVALSLGRLAPLPISGEGDGLWVP